MHSEQTQIHSIKTVTSLKKVSITVRFPCSISFALKHQSNVVDHKEVYDLVKGQCNINKQIQIELQVPFFRGRYEERKISLLIYMVSSNGKIPAGSVTINPTENLVIDKRALLQKCPDKNAFAVFTASFEKVRVGRINTQRGRLSNLASSTVSGYNHLRRSGTQLANSINQPQQKQQENTTNLEVIEISPRYEVQRSDIKLVSSRELKKTLSASESQKRLTPRPPKLSLDKLPKRNFQPLKESQSNMIDDCRELVQWEAQAQKSKILKLQQEKASYIKRISRLKDSLIRVQSGEKLQLQGEISRIKDQNQSLQVQLRKLRDRSRTHQKKEKQSNELMKEMREQLDKKKNKILQLDSSRHKIEGQFNQKDKIISVLQNQKKRLQEALQQEKSVKNSIQKKIDLKENSYKEQLKKLNQRIVQTDFERQKTIYEYSNLLNQLESNQKKCQTTLRQKERAFNQEKIKLNKRNQQNIAQNAALNEKLDQKNNALRDYEYLKQKSSEQGMENQMKICSLKDSNQSLQNENKQLKIENRSLQGEIQKLQQTLYAQKANFKKKSIQLSQQLQLYKDKAQKLQSMGHLTNTNIKELQHKLKKEIKQKNLLNSKIEELVKIQQKGAQEQQNKQTLFEKLSVQNVNHNQKLSQLKKRLDSQRKKYQLMQSKYEQQVKYLISSKEYLQNQIEELKWQLEKQFQKHQILNIKHRQLGDKNIQLNQQIRSFEEQLVILEQQRKEKSQILDRIAKMQVIFKNYQQSTREYQQNLKKKKIEIANLQQKYKIYQQQSAQQQERSRQNHILQTQMSQNFKKQIYILKIQLAQKQSDFQSLENQSNIAKKQLGKFLNQNNIKNDGIQVLKDINNTLKNDYNALILKYDSIRQQNQQTKKKLNQYQELFHQIQNKLSDLNSLYEKLTNQFEDYKSSNARSLQQLFSLIGSQNYSIEGEIPIVISLPDEQLSLLMIQSLRNYQVIRRKNNEDMYALKTNEAYFESQLMKLQAYVDEREQQHVKQIQMIQKKHNASLQDKNKTVMQLQAKIKELNLKCEQQRNEIQYYSREAVKYQCTISNVTEQIHLISSKEGILSTQIHKLQQELFDIKEKQIKQKLLFTSEASQLKQILLFQRQHHAQIANGLRIQIKDKQKQTAEKAEEIKRLVINESDYKLQINKLIDDAKELAKKIEEQKMGKNNLERYMKDKQKLVKQLQEQMSNLTKQQQNLKQLDTAKQQRIHILQDQFHQQQTNFSKFKEGQAIKLINLQENEKKQREKRKNIEAIKSKLQQQNKQIREKYVRLESQNQFYKFFKAESIKKMEQVQKSKEQLLKELIKCKQSLVRAQKQFTNYQSKIFKLQMVIQTLHIQKAVLQESIRNLEDDQLQSQQKINEFNQIINELQSRQRQNKMNQQTIKSIQLKQERNIAELTNEINKLTQKSNEKSSKIKQLEQDIEGCSEKLNAERQKWQLELDNEKNIFQLKLETIDENNTALQNELEFQKEQSVKQIEGANGIIQELNQIIREKEEVLQHKQEVISELNVRLEQLNLQLTECLAKWQKEKETYMPTASKMAELSQEITRMNTFVGQLDGRNKQLLEINRRKMQQQITSTPSITEALKDLYVLIQKFKNKILGRCLNDKEREVVILDFKKLQDKLDLVIKSPQIVNLKQ